MASLHYLFLLAPLALCACGARPPDHDTFSGIPVDPTSFALAKSAVESRLGTSVPPMHYTFVQGDGPDMSFDGGPGHGRVQGQLKPEEYSITVSMRVESKVCIHDLPVTPNRVHLSALVHEMIHAAVDDTDHEQLEYWYAEPWSVGRSIIEGFGCP